MRVLLRGRSKAVSAALSRRRGERLPIVRQCMRSIWSPSGPMAGQRESSWALGEVQPGFPTNHLAAWRSLPACPRPGSGLPPLQGQPCLRGRVAAVCRGSPGRSGRGRSADSFGLQLRASSRAGTFARRARWHLARASINGEPCCARTCCERPPCHACRCLARSLREGS